MIYAPKFDPFYRRCLKSFFSLLPLKQAETIALQFGFKTWYTRVNNQDILHILTETVVLGQKRCDEFRVTYTLGKYHAVPALDPGGASAEEYDTLHGVWSFILIIAYLPY